MKLDALDKEMREFETVNDRIVPEDCFLVARLDGRNFTGLTSRMKMEKPFDEYMHTAMTEVLKDLMRRFEFAYGYTQSDEISLLFDPKERSFNWKDRKLLSVLAGEASASFALKTRSCGVFDCRLSELPDRQRVIDYFRWRGRDSSRNSLSTYCFWTLIQKGGMSKRVAAGILDGLTERDKRMTLLDYGIDFDEVPRWQRFGTGAYYRPLIMQALNQHSGEMENVNRRELVVDDELPDGEGYTDFLSKLLSTDFRAKAGQ
jgi:tRNA(His) 5'-end guanylyltransferase